MHLISSAEYGRHMQISKSVDIFQLDYLSHHMRKPDLFICKIKGVHQLLGNRAAD